MEAQFSPQGPPGDPKRFFKFYRESEKLVPLLKYARILIVTILILSLTAFFHLKYEDVFLYSAAVLLLSLWCFVCSLFIKMRQDPAVRRAILILMYATSGTMAFVIVCFGIFFCTSRYGSVEKYFESGAKPITKTQVLQKPAAPGAVSKTAAVPGTKPVVRRAVPVPGLHAGEERGTGVVALVAEGKGFRQSVLDTRDVSSDDLSLWILKCERRLNPKDRDSYTAFSNAYSNPDYPQLPRINKMLELLEKNY